MENLQRSRRPSSQSTTMKKHEFCAIKSCFPFHFLHRNWHHIKYLVGARKWAFRDKHEVNGLAMHMSWLWMGEFRERKCRCFDAVVQVGKHSAQKAELQSTKLQLSCTIKSALNEEKKIAFHDMLRIVMEWINVQVFREHVSVPSITWRALTFFPSCRTQPFPEMIHFVRVSSTNYR